MGADLTLVYYGVRHRIRPEDIEPLETRKEPRIKAAMFHGLDHWWGLFRSGGGVNLDEPKDEYFLFIGREIALVGYEQRFDRSLFEDDLLAVMREVKEKLKAAGIEGTVGLWVQFEPDF
jgi:hypothetical protein